MPEVIAQWGKDLALYVANLGLIPGTQCSLEPRQVGSLSLEPGVALITTYSSMVKIRKELIL